MYCRSKKDNFCIYLYYICSSGKCAVPVLFMENSRRFIMKNMKERFHKLITVILCFLVSMVPKRDEVDVSVIGQAVTASPVNGNAASAATVSAENMDKDVNMWIVHNRKHHRMWKKLFFWLQGPGDTKLT